MSMRGCVLDEAAGFGFADRLCRSSVCAASNHEEPSGEQHWSHSLVSPSPSGSTPPPPPAHRARRDATSAGLHTLPGTGVAPADRPNLRAPRASNTATQRFITESAAVDSYAAQPEADAHAAQEPAEPDAGEQYAGEQYAGEQYAAEQYAGEQYAAEQYAGEPPADPAVSEGSIDTYVPDADEIAAATYQQPMQPFAAFPIEEPSSARMPKLALPPPPPRFSAIRRGEALLPERANDPSYYPGLVNDPEPLPVLERKLPPWWKYAAAAAGVFVAGLIVRSMLAGPPTWSAVIDVTPADARVSIDGQPLEGSVSPRTREGLIAGDHVIFAEAPGYVAHRQVFTLEEADRRVVVSMDREPPPKKEEPLAEAPPATPEPTAAQPAAAEPEPPPPLEDLSKLSKKELAKRRRAERVRERYRARKAAAAEGGTSSSKRRGGSSSSSNAAASGATGLLKVNSTPWSEVYVDRRHVGHTPILGLVLPAGKHVIELRNPDTGAKKKLRIKLKAGETLVKIEKLR